MQNTYQVIDKQTNERMIGFHDGVGIYEFSRDHTPHEIWTTMDDMIRILGRIERCTGRKVGVIEVD